jgi:hypothetical protein
MRDWPSRKRILAISFVSMLLLATFGSENLLSKSRSTSRYPLPGEPMPQLDYSGLFSPPAPVVQVTNALMTPLEAAVERLRPLGHLLFPALWDEPKPATGENAYAVRDNALRVVRSAL